MPHIRLMGLVDLPAFNSLNDKDKESYARRGCEGFSKSGLDWTPTPDTDDHKEGSELATDRADDIQAEELESTESIVEGMYEEEEGVDNQPLKSYIMSIHKLATELYEMLDDTDDPEEWVMGRIKEASSALSSIHGHVSYAKKKADSLGELKDTQEGQGY